MDTTLALAPGEGHLWLAFYDEVFDESLKGAYRALLDPSERQQEPRFYFAADRLRYLVTRALVRTTLSRYVPEIEPGDWVFAENAYGRPEIANDAAGCAHLSFNISHTHSLIVLGVMRDGALGVDVENIGARQAPIEVADRFFAPDEVAALAATPLDQQHYRFFEYWTFKEAYIKARGMGLSLPLDQFSFRYPDDRSVTLTLRPELADDAARWRFWQFRPTPQYLVAICAERGAALVVRVVRPCVSERTVVPTILRTSLQQDS
jgi:4'-phosphopantetheinyl transferase